MRSKEKITLTSEKKNDMIVAIKSYFLNERNEDLDDLAAKLIMRFIVEELAPEFYNQGVYDANKYMNDKSEDLLSILIYKKTE